MKCISTHRVVEPYPWRHWWVPALLVAISGLLQLAMPLTGQWLRYHYGHIFDGQLWRLFSGHFVHLGWRHYLMNSVGLLLVYGLYGCFLRPVIMLWWTTSSALGVASGLIFFSPEVQWYVGLSGVLHGLVVAGAVSDIRDGHRSALYVLMLVAVKLLWEQLGGPLPGSETTAGGAVVVDAHLYGALGGLMGVLLQIHPLGHRNGTGS